VGAQRLTLWAASLVPILGFVLIGSLEPSGATGPPGFRAAVQRSVDAHDFTLQVQNPVEQVDYQAPNRTLTKTSNWFMTTAIGSCLYIKVSPTLWAKPSCTGHFGNVLAGRALALGYLLTLSDFTHFDRHGATYTSSIHTHQIPSVMEPVFGVSGSAAGSEVPILNVGPDGATFTMKTSVVVKGGYVVSEELSITGPDGYSGKQLLTYTSYGSSPVVNAPPRRG
jgi:hypothetical protein